MADEDPDEIVARRNAAVMRHRATKQQAAHEPRETATTRAATDKPAAAALAAAPPPVAAAAAASSPPSSSSTPASHAEWNNDRGYSRISYLGKQHPALWLQSLASNSPALYCAQQLLTTGRNYAVMDDFIDADEVRQLRAEVEEFERDGRMDWGEIGKGATASTGTLRRDMRDDRMVWFEGREPWVRAAMRKHILRMDVFAQKISLLMAALSPEDDWEGAGRSKIMATIYRGKDGARYVPHYDNPNRNGRKLTTIVYLNPDWADGDGGVLRLKTDCKVVDVAPLGGRLLCFWSDRRCPHEVLPTVNTRRDRCAVTVWYLDAKERREAEAAAEMKREKTEKTPA